MGFKSGFLVALLTTNILTIGLCGWSLVTIEDRIRLTTTAMLNELKIDELVKQSLVSIAKRHAVKELAGAGAGTEQSMQGSIEQLKQQYDLKHRRDTTKHHRYKFSDHWEDGFAIDYVYFGKTICRDCEAQMAALVDVVAQDEDKRIIHIPYQLSATRDEIHALAESVCRIEKTGAAFSDPANTTELCSDRAKPRHVERVYENIALANRIGVIEEGTLLMFDYRTKSVVDRSGDLRQKEQG